MHQTSAVYTRPPAWLRVVFKMPLALYRWRLGWLLGHRFVLITHVGRAAGHLYQTVVEVVRWDRRTRECVVVSGYGTHADWYRNIQAHPALEITTGRDQYRPQQRFLTADETARELRVYQRRHPLITPLLLRFFGRWLGVRYENTPSGGQALSGQMQMVAFRPSASAPADTRAIPA